MKILKLDKYNNFFQVIPESIDDLWHLERVIEKNDVVSGETTRKIKPKVEGEKNIRIDLYLDIQVEDVEFHKFSGLLRVNGIITGGQPEEHVDFKQHHSLEIGVGKKINVKKEKLKQHQIDRLEKAKKASVKNNLLLVVLDDETADFAILKDFGYDHKAKIIASKEGKRFETDKGTKDYFETILKKIEEIEPEKVIFAGPGFTKNNLEKFLSEKKLKFKPFFESTNSVGVTGLNEIVKSGKIEKITNELSLAKETKIVSKIYEEIAKDGLAVYGYKDVENALQLGAIQTLVISDKKLLEDREKTEELLSKAEELKGEIHIVSSENEAGKQLDGLGGIAAILRYKIQ